MKNIYKIILLILNLKLIICIKSYQNKLLPRSKRFSSWLDRMFIQQGTLWCGKGNLAKSCSDLGSHEETDSCCRDHDSCPFTFISNQKETNGYLTDKYYTISHCECDSIFNDCLHEKPYKPHSYETWQSFLGLNVKCFAYLPCHENEELENEFNNIWESNLHRDTGKCFKGTRVILFDTIYDYSAFLEEYLTAEQLELTYNYLVNDKNRFFSNKSNFICKEKMIENKYRIAQHFKLTFLDKNLINHKNNDSIGLLEEITNVTTTKKGNILNKIEIHFLNNNDSNLILNEFDVDKKLGKKIIFLYHLIIPFAIILAVFIFLKILINLYAKDL